MAVSMRTLHCITILLKHESIVQLPLWILRDPAYDMYHLTGIMIFMSWRALLWERGKLAHYVGLIYQSSITTVYIQCHSVLKVSAV